MVETDGNGTFAILVLLLYLSAGFVFLRLWRFARQATRNSDFAIYVYSIIAALPVYLLTDRLIALPGGGLLVAWLSRNFASTALLVPDAQTVAKASLAIAIAALAAALLNVPITHNERLRRYLSHRLSSDPLNDVILYAVSEELPVLVTAFSGKVYLGYPLVADPYAADNRQALRLFPILSGYRSGDQTVVFNTAYPSIIDWDRRETLNRLNPMFQVTLPVSAITSVAPHDIRIDNRRFEAGGDTADALAQPSRDWIGHGEHAMRLYLIGLSLVFVALLASPELLWPCLLLGFPGVLLLVLSACHFEPDQATVS